MAEGAPVQSAPVEVAAPAYPWPVPETENEWSKLPTCCSGDECKACCKAFWCPCMTMSDTLEKFDFKEGHPAWGDKSSKLPHFVGWTCGCARGCFYPMYYLGFTLFPASYLMYVFLIIPTVFQFLFLWTLMWTRKEITKQFNIQFMKGCGGCCLDCCCPFVCYCWSMQQDQLTIEELKPKEGGVIGEAIEAVAKAAKSLV